MQSLEMQAQKMHTLEMHTLEMHSLRTLRALVCGELRCVHDAPCQLHCAVHPPALTLPPLQETHMSGFQ